jgi:hypothetical protein
MKKMDKYISHKIFGLVLVLMLLSFSKPPRSILLDIKSSLSQVQYSVKKIEELQQSKHIQFSKSKPDIIIRGTIDSTAIKPEGYKIVSKKNSVEVTGGDAVGLMYGLLEVKNQLKNGNTTIVSKEEAPNLEFRAIKFNLPWDSYRRSPALQLHQETCRDIKYWESFLDMMVENRFNKLTLWNLHPFSYMVKTTKYPEGCSLNDAELAEWQVFWKQLFSMAKNRGIETYLVNWNIFVSPEFAKAHNVCDYCIKGKHFVPKGDTSDISKDFMRESVKAVIDTYPDLTGLGITLGEGMGGMTAEEREQWLLDGYVQGMRDASRKVKFIHRVPLSAGTGSGGATSVAVEQMTRRTLDSLTCVKGPINIELKFNWSHSFSTPDLIKVHGGALTDAYWNPIPKNYKLAWMMRNEDFFMLRWGQTDFFRRHIEKNVNPAVNGYFVGSEAYIPAKDYITSLPGASYKYAFDRQWMFYKVMGRLLYNPKTQDSFFIEEFEQRFPKQGENLFKAQTKVSKVPLVIASWKNATWDFSLYSEGMLHSVNVNKKKAIKLISLDEIANKDPMEPKYLSIADFLKNEKNLPKNIITPLHLADSLETECKQALKAISTVVTSKNTDLLYEVSDIKAWAYLGYYFSNKLRAAVAYKRFKQSNKKENLDQAIAFLTTATANWHDLVLVTSPVYKPVPLAHFAENDSQFNDVNFHWSIVEKEVVAELDWLKSFQAK